MRERSLKRLIVWIAAAGLGAVLSSCGASDGASSRPPAEAPRFSASSGDECNRPYAPDSPWNTPIGDATYHPRSADFVSRIRGPLTSDPSQYTYPVYRVTADTPLQTVRVDGIYSNVSDERTLNVQRGGTVRLPIPDGAAAASGSDAQIILVNEETGDEWGAWRLQRSSGGWQIENGYHYDTRWSGVPPAALDGKPFGSRGAGVPYLAGLVRPCELARGKIDHALAFAYSFPAPSHVYPATKSDGAGTEGLDVPEGTRLQLDPTLTAAQIKDFGCNGPCLTIARALQEYGMYAIDNSGRAKVMLEYEGTANWRGTVDAKTVSPIPISSFKVVQTATGPRTAKPPAASSRRCTITGTAANDTLTGTRRNDVICGLGGNDRIHGGGGSDRLYGGPGNDRLNGGAGSDRLYGEAGRDTLRAGTGGDLLSGGTDHDVLLARNRERDTLRGGPGDDRATVDRTLDTISSIRRVTRR